MKLFICVCVGLYVGLYVMRTSYCSEFEARFVERGGGLRSLERRLGESEEENSMSDVCMCAFIYDVYVYVCFVYFCLVFVYV